MPTPPIPPYLLPEEIKVRLIKSGDYTEEDVPGLDDIQYLIDLVVMRFELWLGYSMPLQQYAETLNASYGGVVLMTHSPVKSVVSVHWTQDQYPGYETSPTTLIECRTLWHPHKSGRRLEVLYPSASFSSTQPPEGVVTRWFYDVVYMAGYDPIPNEVKLVLTQLLLKSIRETGISGDLSFLDMPRRDVASVSIPGGVTKTYRVSSASGGAGSGGTELDIILTPLNKYRKQFVL